MAWHESKVMSTEPQCESIWYFPATPQNWAVMDREKPALTAAESSMQTWKLSGVWESPLRHKHEVPESPRSF